MSLFRRLIHAAAQILGLYFLVWYLCLLSHYYQILATIIQTVSQVFNIISQVFSIVSRFREIQSLPFDDFFISKLLPTRPIIRFSKYSLSFLNCNIERLSNRS